MRAVLISRQVPKGPVAPEVLYVEDWAVTPEPAAGELRVRAIATVEVYFKLGSIAQRNNNPGNLGR